MQLLKINRTEKQFCKGLVLNHNFANLRHIFPEGGLLRLADN